MRQYLIVIVAQHMAERRQLELVILKLEASIRDNESTLQGMCSTIERLEGEMSILAGEAIGLKEKVKVRDDTIGHYSGENANLSATIAALEETITSKERSIRFVSPPDPNFNTNRLQVRRRACVRSQLLTSV